MNRSQLYLRLLLAICTSVICSKSYAQSSAPTLKGQKYICTARHDKVLCPSGLHDEILYPPSMQSQTRWAKIYKEEVTFPQFFATTEAAKAFNANRSAKSDFIRYVPLGSRTACGPTNGGSLHEAYKDTPPPGLTPEQMQKIADADAKLNLEFNGYKEHARKDCNDTFTGRSPSPSFGPFQLRITDGGSAIYDPVKKKFVSSKGTNEQSLIDGEYAWVMPAIGEMPFGYRHLYKGDESTRDLIYTHERHFIMQCCGPPRREEPSSY